MKKLIKLLALLSWLVVIFILSSQKGDASSVTSNYVVELLYKFLSIFDKHISDLNTFIISYAFYIRKLAHFTEFAILAILFYINIKEYIKKNTYLLAIIFSLICALLDEMHQLFVSNRYGSIKDVFIDLLGIICGISFYHFIDKRCLKK